jgi:hypothetical protein
MIFVPVKVAGSTGVFGATGTNPALAISLQYPMLSIRVSTVTAFGAFVFLLPITGACWPTITEDARSMMISINSNDSVFFIVSLFDDL